MPTKERVAKADLRGKRGRKNDTFVTTSSLDAARCAVGGWKTQGERGEAGFHFKISNRSFTVILVSIFDRTESWVMFGKVSSFWLSTKNIP